MGMERVKKIQEIAGFYHIVFVLIEKRTFLVKKTPILLKEKNKQ